MASSIILSIALAASAMAQEAAVPLQATWSSRTYGPDGPWQAVTVNFGSPGTAIDLLPGGTFGCKVLSSDYCTSVRDILTGSMFCTAQTAGLYDPDKSDVSSTYLDTPTVGYQPSAAGFYGVMPSNGSASIVSDSLSLDGVNSRNTIVNTSINVVSDGYNTLPNGVQYPFTIGTLSLGASNYNQSFGYDSSSQQSINYTIDTPNLYRNGRVPSASVALHIGSAVMGIPGSMVIGGYDQSRILGDVSSQPYNTADNSPAFALDLLDIGFEVSDGDSPFNYTERDGMLRKNSGSNQNSALTVQFQPEAPYMFLPRATCDAMARDLPVTFSSDYGVYLWNTSDPNYSQIVSSASYLTFTFRANGPDNDGNLTINVPWSLLNLTLSQPIVSTNTQYFPCYPYDGSSRGIYTLGRAFLQAAFFAVNWAPSHPPGTWFLAQAPGPGISSSPSIVPFVDDDTTLQSSSASWDATWAGHWTVLGGGNGDQPADVSTGLSRGAQAGIGVGVAVGALLLIGIFVFGMILLRRRRRARAQAGAAPADSSMLSPPPTYRGGGAQQGEGVVAEKRGLAGPDGQYPAGHSHYEPHEAPAYEIGEMPGDQHLVHEMPAESQRLMGGRR